MRIGAENMLLHYNKHSHCICYYNRQQFVTISCQPRLNHTAYRAYGIILRTSCMSHGFRGLIVIREKFKQIVCLFPWWLSLSGWW
jgi:hypothetical protein